MANREVIFSKFDYTLVYETDIGREDTPLERLKVISSGAANKHVIEIRLDPKTHKPFNGEPVKYIYNDIYISHGMRMAKDTLKETDEYILALQEAVEFAILVRDWCKENGWWSE